MESLLSTIQVVRQKFGATMTDDECALLCNEVAWQHRIAGWGLSRKVSGTRGHLPNGTEIAHDILHHQPSNTLVDILVGAGAQSSPTWNPVGPPQSADRTWVAPVDPRSFGSSSSTPTTPPASDVSQLLEDVRRLTAEVQRLSSEFARLKYDATLTAEGVQRLEAALKNGLPLRIKTIIGKIVGTVGGE